LATALQAGDVTAINEEGGSSASSPFLHRADHLRVTGRAAELGAVGPLATAVGASIVDPWVSQIVNPENLAQLLRGGTAKIIFGSESCRLFCQLRRSTFPGLCSDRSVGREIETLRAANSVWL
jgi:hypothetical protein